MIVVHAQMTLMHMQMEPLRVHSKLKYVRIAILSVKMIVVRVQMGVMCMQLALMHMQTAPVDLIEMINYSESGRLFVSVWVSLKGARGFVIASRPSMSGRLLGC